MSGSWDPNSLTPLEALQRLADGNKRFLEKRRHIGNREFRAELAEQGQRPFAIVLGCSDSRTPVEILFDEGFGDLFVVRIAGNVVAPSVVGSIEFAASQFGTRLVVVLGHTRCGAIAATVHAISDRPRPRVEEHPRHHRSHRAAHRDGRAQRGPAIDAELLREAMRANVRASADHLRHGSQLLEELVMAGRVAWSAPSTSSRPGACTSSTACRLPSDLQPFRPNALFTFQA